MSKKIKVNIPGFGDRECSDDVEYNITHGGSRYIFLKKGTIVCHNEYGPAIEWKNGTYEYWFNNECHNINGPAVYDFNINIYYYYVNHKLIGRDDSGDIICASLSDSELFESILKKNIKPSYLSKKEYDEEEKYARILTSVPKGNCPCNTPKLQCDYHK